MAFRQRNYNVFLRKKDLSEKFIGGVDSFVDFLSQEYQGEFLQYLEDNYIIHLSFHSWSTADSFAKKIANCSPLTYAKSPESNISIVWSHGVISGGEWLKMSKDKICKFKDDHQNEILEMPDQLTVSVSDEYDYSILKNDLCAISESFSVIESSLSADEPSEILIWVFDGNELMSEMNDFVNISFYRKPYARHSVYLDENNLAEIYEFLKTKGYSVSRG